jgi:hypothetical protein
MGYVVMARLLTYHFRRSWTQYLESNSWKGYQISAALNKAPPDPFSKDARIAVQTTLLHHHP